ncbi:hypothetical protein GCM10009001_08330 [Virgibacillus siamensis]|uniref:Uncharacterized protein n=1 Tax=Virgibacillus siamensis TaxID=480071 RepID=A0ABP3QNV4_9BACI
MGGRKFVLLIVAVTLILIITVWLTLQSVMVNYDVDRDTSQPDHTSELQSIRL